MGGRGEWVLVLVFLVCLLRGGGVFGTYTQFLPLHVVRLSPERTRRRQRFVFSAPVRHVRAAGDGRRVDDGHGVGGEELVPAVVGPPERGGQVPGLVEPEEAEEDLGGGSVAADFEDQRGPEGGVGEVVSGHGDGVVGVVFSLVALDFELGGGGFLVSWVWSGRVGVLGFWGGNVSGAGLRTDESSEAFEASPYGGWAYDVDV